MSLPPHHHLPLPADVAPVLASVDRVGPQLGLDAQQLVVLGQALRAAGRARLDLARRQTHGEVGNERVLGLARAVRGHHAPPGLLGHAHGLDRLRDRPDLVDLEQERVAGLLLDGRLDASGVGHEQVVPDDLAEPGGGERGGVVPVVLVEGVLDGDDGVVLAEGLVEVEELLACDLFFLFGSGFFFPKRKKEKRKK